jgi:Amt family ammonium transporter
LIDWLKNGKPTAIGAISGAVAGLVGVTPAAGFVTPIAAVAIGLVSGSVCYVMVVEVKKLLGYDDTLDVFGIHGVGGAIGAVATGIFATSAINPIFKDAAGSPLPVGLIEGNAYQVVNQLAGVGIAVVLGVVGTFVILKVVDLTIGLRVSEEEELAGLDATQHGEIAYVFESMTIAETEVSTPPASHGSIDNLLPTRIPLES